MSIIYVNAAGNDADSGLAQVAGGGNGPKLTLANAYAAASAGDVIHIMRGAFAAVPSLNINKEIWIRGEGRQSRLTFGASHGFVLDTTAGVLDNVRISDLALIGNGKGGGAGTFDAIRLSPAAANKLQNVVIERCGISAWARHGIDLSALNVGAGATVKVLVRECNVTAVGNVGMQLKNATMVELQHNEINDCGGNGIFGDTCPIVFAIRSCAVEGCNTLLGTAPTGNAHVAIKLSHGFIVDGLDVEAMPTDVNATKTAITVDNCIGGRINQLSVSQTAFQTNSIGVKLRSAPCKGISIDQMNYSYITTPISVDSGCENPFIRAAGIVKFAP